MNNTTNHHLYGVLFDSCNVNVLRQICRSKGMKKWYKPKKKELVSFIVLNHCAIVITRLLHRKTKKDDRWCPISLTPIYEIKDPFVHDNVVFSRQSLIDYFKHSVNFTNPGTTSDFTYDDINRLNCEEINKLFQDRIELRNKIVDDVYTFSYFEDDLEETLYKIIDARRYRCTMSLREARIKFHGLWIRMVELDKNRTICVLRAIMSKCHTIYRRSFIGLNYSLTILSKYISETEYEH